MKKLAAVALAACTVVALTAGSAPAGVTPAQKCASSERKLAGNEIATLTQCASKAITKGLALSDPSVTGCIGRAKGKLISTWGTAEARGGCAVTGDVTTIEDEVEAHLADLESLLDTTGPSKCTSAKMRDAGKKAKCELVCAAKASIKGLSPADSLIAACVQKCSDKFVAAFVKDEAGGDCDLPPDDAGSIEALIDAFVDEVSAEVLPTPTTTTTTTLPATCDGTGNIDLPTKLPHQLDCFLVADPTTYADCNGWTPVHPRFDGGELQAADDSRATARVFQWEPKPNPKHTVCWYIYREPNGRFEGIANGTLCFNQDTCDVCAFDKVAYPFCSLDTTTFCTLGAPDPCDAVGKGTCTLPVRPTMLSDLNKPGPAPFDNCSRCHAAGTITPKQKFYNAVSGRTKALNLKCAGLGGPNWIGAPAGWATRATMHAVNAPATDCVRCHSKGFVNPLFVCSGDLGKSCDPTASPDPCVAPSKGTCTKDDFCAIVEATFAPTAPPEQFGAMVRRFTNGAECYKFAQDMNCQVGNNALICPPTTTTTTTTTATTTTT